MHLPDTVKRYLEESGAEYSVMEHASTRTLTDTASAAGIPLSNLLRAVILTDGRGYIMAIAPADRILEFNHLSRAVGRELVPAPATRVAALFADCARGSVPPLAAPYGLKALVDNSVARLEEVWFEPGDHHRLIRMRGEAFRTLYRDARHGAFTRPPETLAHLDQYELVIPDGVRQALGAQGLLPPAGMEQRIRELRRLPAMPQMAARLLRLRDNPRATIAQLAELVATDPSLTAQVIRYARSPFFGYRGKVESIEDAIGHVLGFDMVLNMALGLATGQTFRNPLDGPLGLQAFWRHALQTATLTQALAAALPLSMHVRPGMAYLVGLLHDFGHLLMGHLFHSEFYLLNKLVEANPEVPATLIEKRLLGTTHAQLGGQLMEHWRMPEEVIVAVREHHNEAYAGEHALYSQLVLLADHRLKRIGDSDASAFEPPPAVLTALGLSAQQVEAAAQRLLGSNDGLAAMAKQMAA